VHRRADIHFADKSVLVDPAASPLGLLCPHLFDILQDHIAVAIKSFHSGKDFAVVSAGNEDLCVGASSSLK
jgi:hypothetical protein